MATAQTASLITDDDFSPPPATGGEGINFGSGGTLTPPPGAENFTVTLDRVVIEGGRPEMAAEAEALRARLTAGQVTVADIYRAASDLEGAYARRGFVLARVAVPEQTLNDGGTLRLQVVDGFIENVETKAVAEEVRGRIEQLTAPLSGRPGLTQAEIERRLLLAGDTYGVALGSAIATGATSGGTILILDSDYRPVTGFFTVDNHSSEALGPWSLEAGVEFNGLLGFGEVFYGRASGKPDGDLLGSRPTQRTLVLGAIAPIGSDGISLNFEATRTDTNPGSEVADTQSTFERQSFRLSYPWIRSLDTNLTTRVSLDFQEDELSIRPASGGALTAISDKTRVLRFSGDLFSVRTEGAIVEAGSTLSFSIDGLGADSELASFTTLEVSGRYRAPVGEKFNLSLAGRAQTSLGDAVVDAEKFGIATAQELSALDQGSLSGDSGWVARAEVAYPIETSLAGLPGRISPYVFAAAGGVTSHATSQSIGASALGIGVEVIQVRDPAFSERSLRIELGEGNRDDGGDDGTRASVVGSIRF